MKVNKIEKKNAGGCGSDLTPSLGTSICLGAVLIGTEQAFDQIQHPFMIKTLTKVDNLQEALSKEIQDIKLKQEEVKNTITEIKNSLEAANSRRQEPEERISEVENGLVEIMDAEQKRQNRL